MLSVVWIQQELNWLIAEACLQHHWIAVCNSLQEQRRGKVWNQYIVKSVAQGKPKVIWWKAKNSTCLFETIFFFAYEFLSSPSSYTDKLSLWKSSNRSFAIFSVLRCENEPQEKAPILETWSQVKYSPKMSVANQRNSSTAFADW